MLTSKAAAATQNPTEWWRRTDEGTEDGTEAGASRTETVTTRLPS